RRGTGVGGWGLVLLPPIPWPPSPLSPFALIIRPLIFDDAHVGDEALVVREGDGGAHPRAARALDDPQPLGVLRQQQRLVGAFERHEAETHGVVLSPVSELAR